MGGGFIGKCYGLIKFFSRKPLKIRESFFPENHDLQVSGAALDFL